MAIYTYKTDDEVRKALKEIYGPGNAKVTRNGEVHVKGRMPNTNQVGWYLLGFTGNSALDDTIWLPDGSLNMSLCK